MLTVEQLLDELPDDAPIPAALVRVWLKQLREQHDKEIEDTVRKLWLLRDLRDVKRHPGEATN